MKSCIDSKKGNGLRSLLRLSAFMLVLAYAGTAFAGAQNLSPSYSQNFDTLITSGSATFTNDSTIPGWYSARTGTGATIVANDGSSNAGNLYSYGTSTNTDRALGTVGSGNAAVGSLFYGVRLVNNTGSTITGLTVTYVGEQWRNSAAAAQTVDFAYQIGATGLTSGTWTDVNTLDFTSPVTGGTAGALNGNVAPNRTAISGTISGLNLAPGQEIWLRWSDIDHSGSDHGLAIDDLTVIPVNVVNGSCGTDNGLTLAATAPTNLCSAGTASAVGGNGHPWDWTCAGSGGGSTASCSATIQSYTLSFATDGNGTLSGFTPQTLDYGGSASPVTANANGGYSFVNWTGTNGFVTTTANPLTVSNVNAGQTITANFTASAINGACGTDNGQTLAATAPTNLCSAGSASSVTGSGHPWNWSCTGANGGTTAGCSAAIQSYTLNFIAGANGTLSGSTSQTVDFGGSTTPVTATANSGNIFKNWTGTGGFVTTTANPLTINGVTASQTVTANFSGYISIFHVNDTHARLTPHKWVIPSHGTNPPVFEDVGGAAYLAGKMLQLTGANPNSLVIDAGDISEGNPIGDMNGNGSMTQFYTMLSAKLLAQRGRGMDAVVVGNHDVRDVNYISNLDALRNSGVPLVSVNVRDIATHQPHFAPYSIVTVNGTKIGILGYTTQSAEVGASLASTIEVVDCDWSGTAPAPACHLADYVNDLRNNQGVDIVVLAAHIGHSALVDPAAPLLVDDGAAKLPEVVVSGHWHTWADTVWQPEMLNDKTIFTESSSYMKYIGELQINDTGGYVSSTQHVIRNVDIIPDPEVQTLVNNLTAQYNTAHPGHPVDEVIGYTADNLLLDNTMKWWSAEEYPWSGNNTAGQWICDAMQWKSAQLFGQTDLAIEAGGGVRADIPAGQVTYLQIYETFPWNDDTFYRINMTGQEIVNFLKTTNMDAGFSSALKVTAYDGVPSSVQFNACAAQDTPCWQPINLNHTYTVAINNYMYAHPPTGWTWSDTSPLTSTYLCREGIADFMRQQHPDQAHAYQVGGPRYILNTEFSGGYRAVVTMMNDNDTKPTYEDAFIRFLSATPETVARRGSPQVPVDLVNADGTVNAANRLSEAELYRSYLGFKTGALMPGDIIETWGKGSFYGGNPEFVDQEGVYSDKREFMVVGHDDSLAKPVFMSSIGAFWNDNYKNHYVQFLAIKSSAANNVTDQYGQTIKLWDATGYAAKTIPGNTGDTLLVSGVLTMESYGFRFRCGSVTTTTTSFPATSVVSSHVIQTPAGATASPLTLAATASSTSGTYTLTPVADAQVASGNPSTNYGGTSNLYVQSDDSGYGNERGWLKFDLSGIPAGSTISSANLQLWNWKTMGASMPAEVRGGTDDTWTETGINWSNQPGYGTTALATQTLVAGTPNVWYSWDVSSFVQGKWSGNKLVSLVVKPVTEGSTDTTAPSYGFDAKEYGSNGPVLQVNTQAASVTIAHVDYYYRYSSDNSTWGAWTLYTSSTTAPYTASFSYPHGQGYYEFYSRATDSDSNVEPAPAAAQAATHYNPSQAYYPTVSLDNLYQRYDGSPKTVGVTTIPVGASYNVTYNGSSSAPANPGIYWVTATASQGGNTATTAATLTIGKGAATVNLNNWSFPYDGSSHGATASTIPSELAVSYTYNGSSIAPTNSATYNVVANIIDSNYQGSATGTLIITPATATVTLGTLSFTYDGATKNVTATTNPAGLAVTITYNGSTTSPTAVGSYDVVATISNPNYQGSATGTMTISDATAAPVPALGPWGILVAAALLGGFYPRRRSQNR